MANNAKKQTGKHLVIVESPAKARTVGSYLGNRYVVMASGGHIRDLPEGRLGVDVGEEFTPEYVIMKGKKSVMADLKKQARQSDSIYLATDPDREGEAFSWHLKEAAGWQNIPVRRVVFHEITPEAVQSAFENDREIDMGLVNAQQARRILDRLVGYQLSPLLWSKVRRGTSAGRVQSIALRMAVEREREIGGFTPEEYWSLKILLKTQEGDGGQEFEAGYYGADGDRKRQVINNEIAALAIRDDLMGAQYHVDSVVRRQEKRRPAAPFITSTLQQEAWRQLRMSASRTMAVAQQLYDGVSVDSDGTVGLITYMRTDSPQLAPRAIEETRKFIQDRYGKLYLPASVRRYSSKSKVAQEAHEAIRPTSVFRDPDTVRPFLARDQFKLYELIWKRLVASQMADAILDAVRIEILALCKSGQSYRFRASGSAVNFPGFRTVYMEAQDEVASDSAGENAQEKFPPLEKGQVLACVSTVTDQHFTDPPPRFTEASLIRKLEEQGIGRPSTYAPTISTLVDRQYVNRERGSLHVTKLGEVVNDQLMDHFPVIMDLAFTAQMEEQLDEVANGRQEWIPLLDGFYRPFSEALESAHQAMPRVKVEEPTEETCEKCDRPIVIKWGKFGRFLACSGFPECRNSRPLLQKTGAKCPMCDGDLVKRQAKRRPFYGCSNYPNCEFTVSRMPLAVVCPECSGLLIASGRDNTRCMNCAYQGSISELDLPETF